MSVEKAFYCYNGHAFALIARGSDCLRGWAVGHYGINVYVVGAEITRGGGSQTAELAQGPCIETPFSGERRLPACNRRQLADDAVFDKLPNTAGKLPALPDPPKRCSLSFSNRVP